MKLVCFAVGSLAAVACSSPSTQKTGADPVPAQRGEQLRSQQNQVAAAGTKTAPAQATKPVAPPPDAGPPPPPPITAPPADQVMAEVDEKDVAKGKWWKFGGTYFRVWGTTATGSQPKSVCVSHDGKRVYVTNTGYHDHHNVSRFDPITLKEEAYDKFPGNAIESMVSPDDSVVWVSNFYHKEVLELDGESLEVKRRFSVQGMPKHFDITPDHKTLWISNWASGTTSIVDLASGKAVEHVEVGKQPRGTAVLNSGKKVYVTNFGSHSVSVIDAATHKVIKNIETNCRAPRHADVTADDTVLVTCYGGHELLVIDSDKDEIVRRLDVGDGPKTVEISKDQRFAYTADYRGGTMSMVDLKTWEVLIVPLPTVKTSGLAVTDDDRRIYATGWSARNLMVIERLMPGDQPVAEHGPMRAGKHCWQMPKSDCSKYP